MSFTVFLDRDGVLDKAPAVAVWRWRNFEWLPGAKEAMAKLNQKGIRIALCTNQPFAGLGLVRLAEIHAHMLEELRQTGGRLDRIEAALLPYGRRHKPKPGLLIDAGRAFGTDPERAVMVGDNIKDAEAAHRYGCRAILLATTHDKATLAAGLIKKRIEATIVDDLGQAVDLILNWMDSLKPESKS